jgi:hypothetical protein
MQDQVRNRKAETRDQDGERTDNPDVFTMLVKANGSESEKLQLNDQELVRASGPVVSSFLNRP